MTVTYNPQIVTNSLELCVDPANTKSYSPNVVPSSTDIFAWCGLASVTTGTISQDITTGRSPANGIPLKLTPTSTSAVIATFNSAIWNLAPAAAGQTWTLSFWAKASVAGLAFGGLFSANSSGSFLESPATTFSVTTFWQRFSFSATFSNASTAFVQIRLGNNTSATIWFDGLQVERAASASDFSPRTNTNGSAIYNLANTSVVAAGTLTPTTLPPTLSYSPARLVYSGTSQYISFGNVFNITSTGLSCFAWINHNSIGTNWGPIFSKRNSSNGGWQYAINSVGQLIFSVDGTSGPHSVPFLSNTWYYVGFTITGAGIYIPYVNTVAYPSYNLPATTNTNDFEIGRLNSTTTTFPGSISHATVHTRVLSASEITQNFNATRGRYGI
jgi:hypothetical protein